MEILAEELKSQGFEQDQINEIEAGKKEGLDVSVYAKKEFLAIQMRQIRFGMEEGLNVENYAKPEYDWFQMEEIRKGLLGGVEIEKYASPEISYDRMHQIRWGLSAGIDLSPYKKLNAGILKELRLAIQNRISLVPYINAGYDAEQLEAIRIALEKEVDITPYLNKNYRGVSIKEICEGLDHGLNVSLYARTDYCWQQMREIRLGLEHMVDIEQYNNPFYNWQQMKEIRLGLEDGLDVSYYRSYIYTAGEMQKRRELLQENHGIAFMKEEVSDQNTEVTDLCQVIVSMDGLEAHVEANKGVTELSRTDILKALRGRGIQYGILYNEIDDAINKKRFNTPIPVAAGKPVVDGKDGWYEFFFRTEVARTPKVLEHGNVDYRNIEWFETVEEGQKLAYYHRATEGENGISVTGRMIPAKKGREKGILTGKGFQCLSDGRTYISAKRGIVSIQDLQLEVKDLLVMEEVNLATGDVNFMGNVFIRGNVSSGTKIKASGDIVVNGFVESTEIVCGGSVVLQKGMNASGSGYINAVKDVVGCFFEATEICAGGNIQGNCFLNCKMHAKGKVYVSGKKGVLAGGFVYAEKGLLASNLGNPVGISTLVKIGFHEQILFREKNLDDAIKNVQSELITLGNAHHEFQMKYLPEVRNTMDIYLKIENAIYTKEKELGELMHEKEALENEKKKMDFVSAVIEHHLYEGVAFEIDGLRWNAKSVRSVIIRKKNNRISLFHK